MSARKPLLMVLHQWNSTPGRVGHTLAGRGYSLDIRRPRYGDALPETLADHAGAIIFGGPSSANDTEDFVKREIDWLAVPLKERAQFLGICLGAQMLARHLGSRVYAHPEGQAEVRLVVQPAERGVGQLHHVDVLDGGGGVLLAEDHFQGLGGPDVAVAAVGGRGALAVADVGEHLLDHTADQFVGDLHGAIPDSY